MSTDLNARVDALEQAVKRQYRYTAVMIILLFATLAGLGILSLRFGAYTKSHPAPAPAKSA